jgi:hypothetical protein
MSRRSRRRSTEFRNPPEPVTLRWGAIVVPIVGAIVIVGGTLFMHLLAVNKSLGVVETKVDQGLSMVHADFEELDADVDELSAAVREINERVARIEGSLSQPSRASLETPVDAWENELSW